MGYFTHSDKQMAQELNISESSVGKYKTELKKHAQDFVTISQERFWDYKTKSWSRCTYTKYVINRGLLEANFSQITHAIFDDKELKDMSINAKYIFIYIYRLNNKLSGDYGFYHENKQFEEEIPMERRAVINALKEIKTKARNYIGIGICRFLNNGTRTRKHCTNYRIWDNGWDNGWYD